MLQVEADVLEESLNTKTEVLPQPFKPRFHQAHLRATLQASSENLGAVVGWLELESQLSEPR